MIRKPQAEEFREGAAVTALRESKKIAVEGSKGIGQGVAKASSYWLGGIMLFGFAISALSALGGTGGLWLLAIGGFLFFVYRHDRQKKTPLSANPIVRALGAFSASKDAGPPAPTVAEPITRHVSQSGQLELDIASTVQQAFLLAGAAIILILSGSLGVTFPLMLAGIAILALALLLVARLFSDRVVLRYDHRSVTVTGLLGSSEMLWVDAQDVGIRVYSRFNLKVLFTSGARRNLVISGTRNSLSGPTELLLPVDLLGLEREELVALVSNLICCRAAGGDVVPSWQSKAGDVPQVTPSAPAPSPPAPPAPTPSGDPRASFDPDAIMARYLSDRERLVAEHRPSPRISTHRPTFGRKAG